MPPDIQCVRNVAASAGLRLRAQDLESLSRWMVRRVHALTLPGSEEFAQLLAQDGAAGRRERELLITQFTTGESYFFRDQGQFDLIGQKLLPELIERRAKERTLRIWSAGCAGGEEPYSLAMLVLELAFGSLARCYGAGAVGVLLTGMGQDGARGMLDIARAGGLTIAQDEQSSVVFGMPKRAIELGAARQVLPLAQVGPALRELATGGTTIHVRSAGAS